jgi:hypothetical protein
MERTMKNMGVNDRWIRAVIGIGLLALVWLVGGGLGGAGQWVALAGAAVLILTAAVGTCPAYLPFGIKTCRRQ